MTVIFKRPTLAEARADAMAWIEKHAPNGWHRITVERAGDLVRIKVEVGQ